MAKTVDVYTPAIRKAMENAYTNATADERIAVVEYYGDLVGKSAASVRSVMTRAGYYIKKAYVSKTGNKPVKKEELANKIAVKIGTEVENEISSLTKANVEVLKKILTRFAALENDIKALKEGVPES